MRALNTAFDELLMAAANNENDLIDLLIKLTEAQAQETKKNLSFATRQGH